MKTIARHSICFEDKNGNEKGGLLEAPRFFYFLLPAFFQPLFDRRRCPTGGLKIISS
jgi:hypothetical protein